MSFIYLSKPIESTPLRVSPKVNYGLRVMMCHCRFFNCNKCTTPVRNVDSGGGYCVHVGLRKYMGNLGTNFAMNLQLL